MKDSNNVVIRLKGLTKRYGQQVAVDNLDLEIREKEIFCFLGPNGAGKTTTILMLLGLTEPTSGTADVCGFNPTREALKVKRLIGYLPENVGFYGDMNARQNLRYVAQLNGMSDDVSEAKIEEALRIVELENEAEKKLHAYSRGMRQRLGIAELLIKEPKVVFLDEPTLGLDPDGANRMIELIKTLRDEKQMTILLSSHNLPQVQKISDRVGIMIKGKLVAVGPIHELAKKKMGVGQERYTLEEIYMKYFQEV
jgi:ABC-2 type transport system ATP-binding protein